MGNEASGTPLFSQVPLAHALTVTRDGLCLSHRQRVCCLWGVFVACNYTLLVWWVWWWVGWGGG